MGKNLDNVKQKGVKISLDKDRILEYDFNAFVELEEKFGTIQGAMEQLQDGKLKNVRTILWAGLIEEDETLTEKEVGKMIHLDKIQELAEKINEALSKALPEVKEEDKKKAKN
jgi:hypothetical protein